MEIVEATFSEPPKIRVLASAVEEEEEEEDERDRRPKPRREKPKPEKRGPVEGTGAAKTGMLMLSISLWIYAAMFLVTAVYMLIAWCGGYVSFAFMLIPGLMGIATWVTGLIGFCFLLAGPMRARLLAMLALLFAVLHVCLVFVLANNADAGMFSDHSIQAVGWMNKFEEITGLQVDAMSGMANREKIRREAKALDEFAVDHEDDSDAIEYHRRRRAQKQAEVKSEQSNGVQLMPRTPPKGMRWRDVSNLLAYFDQVVENAIHDPKMFKFYFPSFFGGLVEVIRLLLMLGVMRSTANAVRGSDTARRSMWTMGSVAAALVVAVIVSTVTAGVIHNSRKPEKAAAERADAAPEGSEEARKHELDALSANSRATVRNKHWVAGGTMTVYLIYCGMLIWPAIVALDVRAAADRVPKR